MNKKLFITMTIVFCVFLMFALCGCTEKNNDKTFNLIEKSFNGEKKEVVLKNSSLIINIPKDWEIIEEDGEMFRCALYDDYNHVILGFMANKGDFENGEFSENKEFESLLLTNGLINEETVEKSTYKAGIHDYLVYKDSSNSRKLNENSFYLTSFSYESYYYAFYTDFYIDELGALYNDFISTIDYTQIVLDELSYETEDVDGFENAKVEVLGVEDGKYLVKIYADNIKDMNPSSLLTFNEFINLTHVKVQYISGEDIYTVEGSLEYSTGIVYKNDEIIYDSFEVYCFRCNKPLSRGEGESTNNINGYTHYYCDRCVKELGEVRDAAGLD